MVPYFDPEYENYNQGMSPPRVCIDNKKYSHCTLVKVDSMNKDGILLEVLQVLCDMDLHITKAYISSDGGWLMDVFHCVDKQGQQITDQKTIQYIEKALGPESNLLGARKGSSSPRGSVGLLSIGDHTAIELKGPDRTGLLSEIFGVLAELQCNVLAAEMWTHRTRVACVVYVNDVSTGRAVADPRRLSRIEHRLRHVLRGYGGGDAQGALASFAVGPTSSHVDRRLHQLMHADVAAAPAADGGEEEDPDRPVVTVGRWEEKGYTLVNVKCRDRSKLLYDIVCTLTDMGYVVFHAAITSEGYYGLQEFYIRHSDGSLLAKDEEEKVARCLEAAISRRVCEGFTLELCGQDRVGLLSDVTRVLREHSLTVTRADVTTVGQQAMNVFYVRDPSGKPVDMKTIEGLRMEVGQTVMFNLKRVPARRPQPAARTARASFFSIGNLLARLRA